MDLSIVMLVYQRVSNNTWDFIYLTKKHDVKRWIGLRENPQRSEKYGDATVKNWDYPKIVPLSTSIHHHYPLVNVDILRKIRPCYQWVNPRTKSPFSIAMFFFFTRGYHPPNCCRTSESPSPFFFQCLILQRHW